MPSGIYHHKSGEESNAWKEDNIGIRAVHMWLDREFGSVSKCEHCGRNDTNIVYEWACKNKDYRRVREEFMRLCRSCHRKYDYKFNGQVITEETRRKMSIAQKKRRFATL